jgi:hypothetical protein
MRRGEVAPAGSNIMRLLLRNSNARWRRMFRRELLGRFSELRREGNFQGSKLSGFCSGSIQNTQSTSENRFFVAPAVIYSCRAPCGCCWHIFLLVMLDKQPCTAKLLLYAKLRLLSGFYYSLSKIEYCRSKNCSAGNPPPFVLPGLKRTRTDAILK